MSPSSTTDSWTSDSRLFCRELHRLDDVLIPGAAAKVSFQSMTDLFPRRIRIAIQKLCARDNHSGRAIAALQTVLFPETFLHRIQLAVRSQSFNRGDVRAVGLHGEHCA